MWLHTGFGATTNWGHLCFTLATQWQWRKCFITAGPGTGWYLSIHAGPLIFVLSKYGED